MNEKQVLDEIAVLGRELQSKISERDNLDVEIIQVEAKIRGLKSIFLRDKLAEKGRELTAVGLTDAIRVLMRKHGRPMTAAEVKFGLEVLGFDLKRFKNASAAVANTLLRMAGNELYLNPDTKQYSFARPFYGEVPNPFGRNLAEMLTEPSTRKTLGQRPAGEAKLGYNQLTGKKK
jgi:hypothetical protein